MEEVKKINHQKFFKYMKPKFVSLIEKKSVDLCNVCNGDLARLLEDDYKHSSEDEINEIQKRVEHFCTKSWEFKCSHLYTMVFENLMITEPGLKMFSGCQHLRWYAFSNLALHKDVDVIVEYEISGDCLECIKTKRFQNNQSECQTLFEAFRNLFL
jgi:hypothetical protein